MIAVWILTVLFGLLLILVLVSLLRTLFIPSRKVFFGFFSGFPTS